MYEFEPELNKARLLELADKIEEEVVGFNMELWITKANGERIPDNRLDSSLQTDKLKMATCDCGTVACIAGLAIICYASPDEKASLVWTTDIPHLAGKLLGMTWVQSQQLFQASNSYRNLGSLTREDAVRTLRHFAKTGEVDWFDIPVEEEEEEEADEYDEL